MSSSGEDYDDDDDDELRGEGTREDDSQPSQTLPSHIKKRAGPSKRRKIITSDDDSIEDFIVADGVYEGAKRTRHDRTTSTEENSPDKFEDTEVRKRKSKYKIHVSRETAQHEATVQYGTQQQDKLDSSPYRIRGPKWKLPKTAAPKLSPYQTQKLKQTGAEIVLEEGYVPVRPSATSLSVFRATNSNGTSNESSVILEDGVIMDLASPERPSAADIARELDDLPSDAFLSSPDTVPPTRRVNPSSQAQRNLVGPQTGLRQTTLFGGRASGVQPTPSQGNKVYNYRVDMVPETPTHHELNCEALKTWIYPTNLGPIRDYQFSITRQGLFNNMLVALPTGLGKTFIAATIMLNYFRWTKDSQIVFMAPTRPLVAQQVDACFNIAGIPRSATTLLTGDIPPAVREEEWISKRVFFMTPQTLDNDLRSGIADPKKIVLLVVDEAHRATGNYSYVKVVSCMRRFSQSFRILALTATPGASVEAVQEVIDNLEISKVEIRTEESMDIQQFTHRRKIEQILLDPSDEIIIIKNLFSKALKPLVDQLCAQNAYWNKDPMSLTVYGLMQAQKSWLLSDTGRRASFGLKGLVRALCSILASVAHGIKLLNFHGIGPFYATMKEFKAGVDEKGEKAGKYRKQINESPHFKMMMDRVGAWINKDDFVGHPKLTYLCDTILNHFLDAGEGRLPDGAPRSGTRVIVFSEYRDSAEEICRVLNRHKPMIRASVFVGQADSKRSEGMNQAKQIDTISKFKAGTFNVLVATSIGEEGLDIGQVDLIVCYDASGSPIRMLQRMGRTGRKRAGNIILLLMRGKEEEAFAKAKDGYEQMQKMIASGERFSFRHDLAKRIIPKDVTPTVDKRNVEIPVENTQDHSLPEPKRRPTKAKKKSAKKFHMPDGVKTGFQKASMLTNGNGDSDDSNAEPLETVEDQIVSIPDIDSVLLSAADLKDLEQSYQNVVHGDDMQEVTMPEMTLNPEFQRSLGPVKLVQHGNATKRFVSMIQAMRNVSGLTVEEWDQIRDNEGLPYLGQTSAERSRSSSVVSSVSSSFKGQIKQPGPTNARGPKILAGASKTKRRYSSSLSEDQISNTDCSNGADEDDLKGFVVPDEEPDYEKHTASTPFSSLPPDFPLPKGKPFFEPTKFIASQDTNDDEDTMPELADLLGSRTMQPFQEKLKSEKARRGRRKRIFEEDEDSDE